MQVREYKREDVLCQLELDIVTLEEGDFGFTVEKNKTPEDLEDEDIQLRHFGVALAEDSKEFFIARSHAAISLHAGSAVGDKAASILVKGQSLWWNRR